MTAGEASTPPSGHGVSAVDRRHWTWLITLWVIEMAAVEPIIFFLVWPHLPPGTMTDSARGVRFDTLVATMLANGAVAAVIIYLAYALIVWRRREGDREDGPAIRGNYRIQAGWIFTTSAIVLGAFIFGTYELIVPAGAGSGEGPSPIWTPASKHILPIQVIGQQWYWTFRYPTFGGFETTQLVLPNNTSIAFHVTSLDVIHSFWAYQISVKADANPGVDNVAFTTTNELGRFAVRCDELCGIWHGAMYDFGYIVSRANFERWATSTELRQAPLTRLLPQFSWTYEPSANGAGGSYYPTQDPYYRFLTYSYGSSSKAGRLPAVHVKPSKTNASRGITYSKLNIEAER